MFSFIIIRRQSGALNISAILYIHIQSNQRKLKRNTTYTLTIRSKIFEIRRWFSSAQTKKSVLSDRARLLFDLFQAYCTKITISIIKMLMILAVKSTEFRFVVFKISCRIQPLSCKIHLSVVLHERIFDTDFLSMFHQPTLNTTTLAAMVDKIRATVLQVFGSLSET